MNYSKYQEAIFANVKENDSNIAIAAVAGSGKSTTLVECVRMVPENQTVLVVAFNKDIVTAIQPKIKHPKAQVMTLNSFGNRICRKCINGLGDMDIDKTANILKTFFDMEDKIARGHYYKFRNCVVRLIELFRANLMMESDIDQDQIRETAESYGLELPSEKPAFFELVKDTYTKCLSFTTILDFRDQVHFPIYLDLEIPKFDMVFCDESQDFDRNQMELVLRAAKRLVMVGDPRQAIYGFRGALANAMEQMIKRINAIELPLSISYRCPKSVIKRAQKIVSQIEACDDAPEGRDAEVKMEDFRKQAATGDFVLCRTTAPLVSECLRLIREKRKATVKGREIGQQLTTVIDKLSSGDNQKIEDFYRSLSKYHLDQLERLQKAEREQEIVALNDRVETIRALAESCDDVAGIKKQIAAVFSDTVSGVVFMSCHKAKGLEATRVWILCPELMPHPAAKTSAQKEQESNLLYVAITRCKFERGGSDGELLWIKSEPKKL